MEVVRHQAIAEEPERVPLLRLGQGLEKRLVVLGIGKDVGPVITPVQGMIDQAILDRSQKASHRAILPEGEGAGEGIKELTPISH